MANRSKKFYAVVRGFKPGIYEQWYGENGAEIQIRGFANARYKGFKTIEEAKKWLSSFSETEKSEKSKTDLKTKKPDHKIEKQTVFTKKTDVIIYTDGGAIGNPGPGGYGAVITIGKTSSEISGGFRLTTNNRMELIACIFALESIKPNSCVKLYTDSKYVVNGITKGWAKKWRANNWMRNAQEPAKNPDLWNRLLNLCEKHYVKFEWVKGHANIYGNERCDQLVKQAAMSNNLPPDLVFERQKQTDV